MQNANSHTLGSDGERMEGRHKIESLTARFGNPSLFLTFNPHHDHNCSWRSFRGVEQVDLSKFVYSFSTAEDARVLAANPHLAAKWFKLYMEAIVHHLFAWDMKRQEPKKGGGLFGHVKAFVIAVEEQQRGEFGGGRGDR